MWFKRKKEEPEIDEFSEQQKALQSRIFAQYPAGKELCYMGVRIRITKHTYYRKAVYNTHISLRSITPEIECDYINSRGEILQIIFTCEEVGTWTDNAPGVSTDDRT